MSAEKIVTDLLAKAGITVGGGEAWDITVHDQRTFERVIGHGGLGLGESYMAGWWDAPDLKQFFEKLMSWRQRNTVKPGLSTIATALKVRLFNRQTIAQTQELANAHYNLSNRMFTAMLDDSMAYSCAYWRNSDDLHSAQLAKLDLICRKVGLKEGDHLLDIGCGWGSLSYFAAKHYGARVTGITIAHEQAVLARERCAGLPVEIIESDYRLFDNYATEGGFDAVISLAMAEAVGEKNYREYMSVAVRAVKDDGLFLLHTIGVHKTRRPDRTSWFEKYIFPGHQLPTITQLSAAMEGVMQVEDLHNIGFDYARTLTCWFENFDRYWAEEDDKAAAVENFTGDPDVFYRMWKYYLLSVAASFSVRELSVWQMVMSKHGVPGGYETVR